MRHSAIGDADADGEDVGGDYGDGNDDHVEDDSGNVDDGVAICC